MKRISLQFCGFSKTQFTETECNRVVREEAEAGIEKMRYGTRLNRGAPDVNTITRRRRRIRCDKLHVL